MQNCLPIDLKHQPISNHQGAKETASGSSGVSHLPEEPGGQGLPDHFAVSHSTRIVIVIHFFPKLQGILRTFEVAMWQIKQEYFSSPLTRPAPHMMECREDSCSCCGALLNEEEGGTFCYLFVIVLVYSAVAVVLCLLRHLLMPVGEDGVP